MLLVVCSLGGTTAQKGEFSIRARRLLFTSLDPYQPDNNMMHPMVSWTSFEVFSLGIYLEFACNHSPLWQPLFLTFGYWRYLNGSYSE